MFIRLKTNKSGSKSVMLVHGERTPGKKHPVLKVVKNFGTAADEAQFQKLKNEAESYKAKIISQDIFKQPLNIFGGEDIRSCSSVTCGFNDIYMSTFSSMFAELSLKSADLNRVRDLSVMRIAESCSKRRTAQIAGEYGLNLNLESIYKTMDSLTDIKIEQIKQIIYRNTVNTLAQHNQTVDVLFYDLTTIYFENNSQDAIRNFGFSKDGKHQHVQVMMALMVTRHGLPIGYEIFPGNTYEGHTLVPVLIKLREKYSINRVVLVADAALMNNINLEELSNNNFEYVISARIKNSKADIKKQVLDITDYKDLISYNSSNEDDIDRVKSKEIEVMETSKLICYHSSLRARKDNHDREKAVEKARKYLSSGGKNRLTGALKKSYVKLKTSKEDSITIDEEKLEYDKKFDGYFALCTNIKDAKPEELLGYYRGLWQVEQSFRIIKHNLEIRPVFHYSTRRIKAHFILCYMALALLRQVEFKLKIAKIETSIEQLNLDLRKMRKVYITDRNGKQFTLLEDPPQFLHPVYQALGIKWPQKFKHIDTM